MPNNYMADCQDHEYDKKMMTFSEEDKFHILDHLDEFGLLFGLDLKQLYIMMVETEFVHVVPTEKQRLLHCYATAVANGSTTSFRRRPPK